MIPRRKAHIENGELLKIIKHAFSDHWKQPPTHINNWQTMFAEYIGTKYAFAVSSGRFGMEVILKALYLKYGDEIIIPAYTLKDLIPIIKSLGLTPIPADISKDTFNIDSKAIIDRITPRTKVIIATHMFGNPCRINEILEIAKTRGIFVIEDCAHSAGASYQGRKTGSFGDAAFFSFELTKPINTYGGGMITTDNDEIAAKIKETLNTTYFKYKNPVKKIISAYTERYLLPTPLSYIPLYLLSSKYFKKNINHLYRSLQGSASCKYSYTSMQSIIGMKKLSTLNERIAARNKKAKLMSTLLNLSIRPQNVIESAVPTYYFYIVLLPINSDKAKKHLLKNWIDCGTTYEIADDCGDLLNYNDCFNSRFIYKNAIHLPLYESLTDSKIKYIADVINQIT